MKRRLLYVLTILLFALLFSCNIDWNDSQSASKTTTGTNTDTPKPLSSTMTMTFEGESYSSDDNRNYFSINLDDKAISSGYFLFDVVHNYKTGVEAKDPGFTFSCDNGASLISSKKNSCMVDFASLLQLGTYEIKAKSNVSEEFDRSFYINVTSNLTTFVIDYQIQSAYKKENLEYTKQMLGGTISSNSLLSEELELCAGAVYDFKARDASGNDYTINSIRTDSSDSCIFFRNVNGPSGEMVCQQLDNSQSTVTFRVGNTTMYIKRKITLKDNSTSKIEKIEIKDNAEDYVLSFKKNSPDDPEKHYDYLVNITQAGESSPDLLFCLDYYIWDNDAEQEFMYNPDYKPSKNSNPSWFKRSSLSCNFDDKMLYKVDVDGVLKQFYVTPLEDTLYGEKNRHTYLYARYSTDAADTYRWRWRILVGGQLESIDIFNHTSTKDVKIDNNILEINPGDKTGWVFRAKYVPTTTENKKTIWYVSNTKETVSFTPTGENMLPVQIPSPTNYGDKENNTLIFFDKKENTYNVGGVNFNYYFEEEAKDGISDLTVTYGSNGLNCKLVVLNEETGIYNVLDIVNHNTETIIIKGIASTSSNTNVIIPHVVTTRKAGDKNQSVSMETKYSNNTSDQSYPNTDLGDGNRTYYMPYDGTMLLTFESTFDMENFRISSNMYASQSILAEPFKDDTNKKTAAIQVKTMYYNASEKDLSQKISSLTDNAVLTVYAKEIPINIRIVVFE